MFSSSQAHIGTHDYKNNSVGHYVMHYVAKKVLSKVKGPTRIEHVTNLFIYCFVTFPLILCLCH